MGKAALHKGTKKTKDISLILARLAARLMLGLLVFLPGMVLGLALILLCFLGIFARLPYGEAKIVQAVEAVLANSGVQLHISQFSGPLPGRLAWENLQLADAEGPWLEIQHGEVDFVWLDLFQGSLHLKQVQAKEVKLMRLPPQQKGNGAAQNTPTLAQSLEQGLEYASLTLPWIYQVKVDSLALPHISLAALGDELFSLHAAVDIKLKADAAGNPAKVQEAGLYGLGTVEIQNLVPLEKLKDTGYPSLLPFREASINVELSGSLLEPRAELQVQTQGLALPQLAQLTPNSSVQLSSLLSVDLRQFYKTGRAYIPFRVKAKARSSELAWNMRQLEDLLGPAPSLDVDLVFEGKSSEQGLPMLLERLFLQGQDLTISAKGQVLSPVNTPQPALLTKNPQLFYSQWPLALDVQVMAQVGQVQSLVPELAGSVNLEGKVQGTLPQLGLDMQLLAPSLNYAAVQKDGTIKDETGKINDLNLSLNIPDYSLLKPDTVHGQVLAQAMVKNEKVHLGGNFSLEGQTVKLGKLEAKAANALNLQGDATLTLPPAGQMLQEMEASFKLAIPRWQDLAALLKPLAPGNELLANLYGENTSLNVRLSLKPSQGQNKGQATIDWQIPGLHSSMDGQVYSLDHWQGQASIHDILSQMKVQAQSSMEQIQAGELRWSKAQLDIQGSLDSKLQANVQLEGDIHAQAQASYSASALMLLKLEVSQNAPDSAQPLSMRLTSPVQIALQDKGFSLLGQGLELDILPKGNFKLQGHGSLDKLALKAQASLPIDMLQPFIATSLPTGNLELQASLDGSAQEPRGKVRLDALGLALPGSAAPPLAISLEANILPDNKILAELRLSPQEKHLEQIPTLAKLELPWILGANQFPALAPNKAIKGQILWTGEILSLWNFVPLADIQLSGQGKVDASISGTLLNPQIQGAMQISGGEYSDLKQGILLTAISGKLTLKPAPLLKDMGFELAMNGSDGLGGTYDIQGYVPLNTQDLSITANLNKLKPLRRSDLRISLSGEATVKGSLIDPKISGKIVVDQGDLNITQLPGSGYKTLEISKRKDQSTLAAPPERGRLSVSVQIPNQFYVRGAGADTEWKGSLMILGPVTKPLIIGQISSVRGTVSALGKTFTLSKGLVSFMGSTNPLLDVQLAYTNKNISALMIVGGAASRPKLSFSSQPPQPKEEIISQILFGQSAQKISAFQTLQLASILASGSLDLVGGTRDLLGLDVLRLGSGNQTDDDSDNLTLEVGKYLFDNVYVGMEQGLGGSSKNNAGTGVKVEIDLGKNFNLEGRSNAEASEVGIQWKKDF